MLHGVKTHLSDGGAALGRLLEDRHKVLVYIPEGNVDGDAGASYNNYRMNVGSSLSPYQWMPGWTFSSTTSTAWSAALFGVLGTTPE